MPAKSDAIRPGTPLFPEEHAADGSALLRIIATSDLHGQLLSYDYYANRQLPGSGLARIAGLIAAARQSAPASLLLDNGDFLQGSALAEIGAARRNGRPHPAISAFNTLGYDAVALGNHEFDYGLETLQHAISGAGFPVLSANVLTARGDHPLEDHHLTLPATLIRREIALPDGTRHEVRIGVFALTPPETEQWNARFLRDRLSIRQMEETARAWVPELRRQGADLVICLAHTGIAQPFAKDSGECQAAGIAAIPGLDAVIAGHSHLTFPDHRRYPDTLVNGESGHIGGVPVVQPGHEGSHLGVIDLWLRPDAASGATSGAGRWQVTRSQARVIQGQAAIAALPSRVIREAAAPLRLALARDHSAALFRMRRKLGTLEMPLSTWFANVADSQATRLIGTALAGHTRARLADSPFAGVPVVALVSSFRCGGRGGPLNYVDMPEGHLSLRHVFSLYPFPNTLTALLSTGAGLAARLDQATALFHRIEPGLADQPLTNPAIPAFSFASATGTSYQIDLNTPPPLQDKPRTAEEPGRIRDLRIDGRLLAPEEPVILVLNSHITDDPSSLPGRVVLDEGRLCTDVIVDHIRAQKHIIPDHSPGWRFAPMPGTSVLYDSGSGATARMEEAASLRPEPLGLMPSGFSRFRLHL